MPVDVIPSVVASTDDALKAGLGVLSWNYHPAAIQAGTGTLTSQTIYVASLGLTVGQPVAKVGVNVQTAAAGTNPTGVYVGLTSATTLLAQSANLNSDAGWTSVGNKSFSLSATYTVPATGLYYVFILVNGAWGTTQLQLGRGNSGATAIGSVVVNGTGGTGQAAPPSNGTAVTLTAAPFSFFCFTG